MKRIFKYPVKIVEDFIIRAPITRPLAVQEQDGKLYLWAEVDPDSRPTTNLIGIYGTGEPMPLNPGEYITTVRYGVFVWHIYWRQL